MHPPDAPRDRSFLAVARWSGRRAHSRQASEIAGGSIEDQLRKSYLIYITDFYHPDTSFVNTQLRFSELLTLGRGLMPRFNSLISPKLIPCSCAYCSYELMLDRAI